METDKVREEAARIAAEMIAVCEDMFPSISCEVGVALPREPNRQAAILASIGLGSDDLKGALVVLSSPEFFQHTFPLPSPPTEADVLDWAGEVANQALGGLNNRLAALGCVFSLGIPTVVSGRDLKVDVAENRQHTSLRGRLGDHEVVLVLYLRRNSGGPLFRAGEHARTITEVEGVLF